MASQDRLQKTLPGRSGKELMAWHKPLIFSIILLGLYCQFRPQAVTSAKPLCGDLFVVPNSALVSQPCVLQVHPRWYYQLLQVHLILNLLILKAFISQDNCRVCLQGVCFLYLYFYACSSLMKYLCFILFSLYFSFLYVPLSNWNDPPSLGTRLVSNPIQKCKSRESKFYTADPF